MQSTERSSQAIPSRRALLESRLAARTVAWAHDDLDLTYPEIGSALDVHRRTVMRWAKSKHSPSGQHLSKLERFNELRHLLETVFEDSSAAYDWLHTPVPMLRGRTPISSLRNGALDEVIGLLAALESGSFS